MTQTITVLGAGYVGLTTATLLANVGYKTYLIEPNSERRETIKKGRSFFFEEGLDPLINKVVKDGSLIPTDSYELSIPASNVVISCVGTPDRPDGSSNLDYVFGSAESTIKLAGNNLIYVQKSTVPVGTGSKIEELIKESGKHISYVSNPEFLREGTALYDTLFFDRIVVGGSDKQANSTILDLYKTIEESRDSLAQIASLNNPELAAGQYIQTSLNSAELIKVTANAFLATKISFANSIAKLADAADANVVEVMDAVGLDRRIGRAFLNASRGYGGGCFPKDISGLIKSAQTFGVDMEILKAVQSVNDGMAQYTIDKLSKLIDIKSSTVTVLGLSFKAGTSDARKAPGIKIANLLTKQVKAVVAYDPKAMSEAKHDLDKKVKLSQSIEEAVESADAVILAVDWAEFNNPDIYKGKVVVDAMNMLPEPVGKAYTGIGR